MLALLAALAVAGPAFDEEEEPAGFFLDTPRFRFTIDAWPAPAWAPVQGERLCAVTLLAREAGFVIETFACPEPLLPTVQATLATWKWSSSSTIQAGTALLRLSFLFPSPTDPRTATFVWPLTADGRLTAVPADVVELRADRRCGPNQASAPPAPRSPVTCQATVRLDWLARPTLLGITGCPDRVRDLVETKVATDYQGLCPVGKFGVPSPSEFTVALTVDEGIYHPVE